MSQPFVGQIILAGFNFQPPGWLFCNGQLLSISQYDVLYNLIGTTYGGDGQSTFALPNLQSRIPVHMGQGAGLPNFVIGQATGEETHTLSQNEMPTHYDLINADSAPAALRQTPAGSYFAAGVANRTNPVVAFSPNATSNFAANAVGVTGNGLPHPNIQPVLALNYLIAFEGVYPTQS